MSEFGPEYRFVTNGTHWRIQSYRYAWWKLWLGKGWATLNVSERCWEWTFGHTILTYDTKEEAESELRRYLEQTKASRNKNPFVPEEES